MSAKNWGKHFFGLIYKHTYESNEASLEDIHRKPTIVGSHLFENYLCYKSTYLAHSTEATKA